MLPLLFSSAMTYATIDIRLDLISHLKSFLSSEDPTGGEVARFFEETWPRQKRVKSATISARLCKPESSCKLAAIR